MAGLVIAGLIVVALLAAGIWLMERAGVEPAARAVGRAPDPAEEAEVRDRRSKPGSGILVSDAESSAKEETNS